MYSRRAKAYALGVLCKRLWSTLHYDQVRAASRGEELPHVAVPLRLQGQVKRRLSERSELADDGAVR